MIESSAVFKRDERKAQVEGVYPGLRPDQGRQQRRNLKGGDKVKDV